MATRANVTSVEAIESFRSHLIVYLSKARPALEDASDTVNRTRAWLESDRRIHWQNQVRRMAQKLQDAQQAVFSAELASLREVSTAERMMAQKAKRALADAEEKLALVKKWNRNYATQVEPLAKQLEKLQVVLTNTLPQAIAHLGQTIKTLDEYAGIAPSSTEPAAQANPASEEKEENHG